MNMLRSLLRKLPHKPKRQRRKPPSNIDLERQFLFVHIPKTAGTSVCEALKLNRSHHYFVEGYRDFVDAETFERLYKFAFVRHPVDRFVSLYNYARMEVSHFHNNKDPAEASFQAHADYQLLKDCSLHECAVHLNDGRLVHNQPWTLWLPQTRWLEIDGSLIQPDFLGRMENFTADFQTLMKNLGIDAPVEYMNPSATPADAINVDAATRALLHRYYKEDFDNFGYAM